MGEYTISLLLAEASNVAAKVLDSRGTVVSEHHGKGASDYRFTGQIQSNGIYFVEINSIFGKESFKLIVTH